MLRFRLFRCRQGVMAIEFALVAPVLFLLMMGIIEFALVMYVTAILEGATSGGSRLGKTGFTPAGSTREQYIRDEIERLSSGFIDLSRLDITMLSYDTFENIGQPEPCISPVSPPCPGTVGINFIDINGNGSWDADMGKADAGTPGGVALYRVTYPWPIFTPLIRQYLGNSNGDYLVTAVATVRNE